MLANSQTQSFVLKNGGKEVNVTLVCSDVANMQKAGVPRKAYRTFVCVGLHKFI